MRSFAFSLNEPVQIAVSCEKGVVIGRAEYSAAAESSYLVRYVSADGRATEQWWVESALVATD